MRATLSTRWLLGSASALSLLAACNQILGIDAAEVDARLEPRGQENTVTSGGSSGTQGGSDAAGSSGSNSSSAGTQADGGTGGSHSHGNPEAGAPAEGGSDGGPGPSSGGSQNPGGKGGSAGSEPSSAGETGEGGGGGDGGEDNEPEDLCEQYCDEMDVQCTGVAAQYRDHDQCLRICRMFPEGTVGGPDENSVACRLKYAQKARYGLGTEVNVYCSEAGPSGDGRCGSVCEGFCTLMANVCTPETADVYHFASDEDCRTTCDGLPTAGVSYSSSDPAISDGNHALCRLFHVTSAAMADPEEHCEHALGITLCEAPPQ
jgi:hypothetical protein